MASLTEQFPGAVLVDCTASAAGREVHQEYRPAAAPPPHILPWSAHELSLSFVPAGSSGLGDHGRIAVKLAGRPAELGQLVLVVGQSSSGKTTLLRGLDSKNRLGFAHGWDPGRPIVSHFGTAEEATRWLGRTGLNSIPSWMKPYHVLSTGERFRADVARLLQKCAESGAPAVIDNLGHSLDRQTCAVCIAALARAARTSGICMVVSTALNDVGPWLQPDLIVRLNMTGDVAVLRNGIADSLEVAAVRPVVSIEVHDADMEVGTHKSEGVGFSTTVSDSECIRKSKNYSISTKFCCDYSVESKPTGGTVVYANVECDSATDMCNQYFDTQFSGQASTRVPPFPCLSELADFTIGLVVGPSGTGKSLILKHCLNGINLADASLKALLSGTDANDFIRGFPDAAERLVAASFSGENILGRAGATLSSGELHRLSVIFALDLTHGSPIDKKANPACIDEFTCALGRREARSFARSVAHMLRASSTERPHVFFTCHNDVGDADGLDPDWIYHTDTNVCTWRNTSRSVCTDLCESVSASNSLAPVLRLPDPTFAVVRTPIPKLTLCLRRCLPSTWAMFRDHHYKSKVLSPSAETWMLEYCDKGSRKPVGFAAVIRHNGPKDPVTKEIPRRAHRTVILPLWQGVGIGGRLTDAIGELYRRRGARFFGQTVHPMFGPYRDRSPLWIATEWNHQINRYKIESWQQRKKNIAVQLRVPRRIFSHEYVGISQTTLREASSASIKGIFFVHGHEAAPPSVQNVDRIDTVGARSPFDIFGRVQNCKIDRSKLVKLWQKLPAVEKNKYVDAFRSAREQRSKKFSSNRDSAGAYAIADDPAIKLDGSITARSGDTDAEEGFIVNSSKRTNSDTARSTTRGHSSARCITVTQIDDFISMYAKTLSRGEVLESANVTICGHVTNRRQLSCMLVFVDVVEHGNCGKQYASSGDKIIQLVLNRKRFSSAESFSDAILKCQVGDVVQARGHPGKTRTGTGSLDGLALVVKDLECTLSALDSGRAAALLRSWQGGGTSGAAAAEVIGCRIESLQPLANMLSDRRLQLKPYTKSRRQPLEGCSASEVVPPVQPTAERCARLEKAAAARQRGLFLVLENPNHPGNVAAVLRCADAFGVTEVIIISSEVVVDRHRRFRSQSSSAHKWVSVTSVKSVDKCVELLRDRWSKLKTEGDLIHFGTAVHSSKSTDLFATDFNPVQAPCAVALWFGNEVRGLSDNALHACQEHVFVPMSGIVESLNLAVTVGILLAEVNRQRAAQPYSAEFRMTKSEQAEVIERWCTP